MRQDESAARDQPLRGPALGDRRGMCEASRGSERSGYLVASVVSKVGVARSEDELNEPPSSWQADRDPERLTVVRDVSQDDDRGDDGERAKTRHGTILSR